VVSKHDGKNVQSYEGNYQDSVGISLTNKADNNAAAQKGKNDGLEDGLPTSLDPTGISILLAIAKERFHVV